MLYYLRGVVGTILNSCQCPSLPCNKRRWQDKSRSPSCRSQTQIRPPGRTRSPQSCQSSTTLLPTLHTNPPSPTSRGVLEDPPQRAGVCSNLHDDAKTK